MQLEIWTPLKGRSGSAHLLIIGLQEFSFQVQFSGSACDLNIWQRTEEKSLLLRNHFYIIRIIKMLSLHYPMGPAVVIIQIIAKMYTALILNALYNSLYYELFQ